MARSFRRDAKADALRAHGALHPRPHAVQAPLFAAHDAKEFADFSCKTCHGPGAEKGEFHMPYDGLPPIGQGVMDKYKKEDIEWMATVIKPKMAALLKEPEYTPENPNGFGCLGCHPAAK